MLLNVMICSCQNYIINILNIFLQSNSKTGKLCAFQMHTLKFTLKHLLQD